MKGKFAEVQPVTRTKRQAQSAYDRMSGWYEFITDPFEGRYRRQGLALLQPQSGERLLEIGAGPGQTVAAMAALIEPEGRVAGLDISMGMLKRASQRLERAGLPGLVWLQQGDGAHLPYCGNSFDALFMSFTLELFDTHEILKVLSEARRVLRDSGRLVVVSMAKQPSTNVVTGLYLWFRERFPTYADCRPIWVQRDLESAGFDVKQRLDFSIFGLPAAALLAAPT